MIHSMLGLPLYPAGHSQVGLWLMARQIAVGAHSSILQGSIHVRERRSHAKLVGQSWLYWQTGTRLTVAEKGSKCQQKIIKQTWKVRIEQRKHKIGRGNAVYFFLTTKFCETDAGSHIATRYKLKQKLSQHFVMRRRMTVKQELR